MKSLSKLNYFEIFIIKRLALNVSYLNNKHIILYYVSYFFKDYFFFATGEIFCTPVYNHQR